MGYKEKFEDFLDKMQGLLDNAKKQGHIIVRVEDLERTFPELREEDSKEKPNGGIVMEDFNEGNGFYKVNLNYLNKEQVEEIEGLVKKWNPELKESEDEKIRKKLISFIENWDKGGIVSKYTSNTNDIKRILAWLEKQGEQKELTVLNFRKGDIIEYKSKQWTIIGVDLDNHCYDLSNDECVDFDTAHYAFKLVEQKPKVSEENDIDEEYKIGKWFTGLIPCWINAPSTLQPEHSNHGKNVVAVHLKGGGYRCCCIDDKKPITFSVAENTPFVEGWHNRESSAWSEKDEEMLENIIICADKDYFICKEHIDWLKSLKDRLQPKQEWSKEDENTIKFLISHFCSCHPTRTFQFTINEVITHDELLRKIRHLKSQSTWKPSEEQMKALEHAISCYSGISPTNGHEVFILEIMKEQLKKLREE